nr:MAG TPA: ATP synthase subunit alpha [Crassvirales sp.]DAW42229.1 MAG TPA: ATP synthase subunit alpha [Crassvirales sp.]
MLELFFYLLICYLIFYFLLYSIMFENLYS